MTHPHPELGPPPELPADGLRVVALGGLGEIGRNMTVLEHRGRLLIIDCGVLFPEDNQPGVDLILPDFEYIEDRLDDVEAIVLTHGHEDHIGAVPYLLRSKPDIPLLGSRLTLALLEAKLREHRIQAYTAEVSEGQRERLGPFEVEFLAVNHSIPDALALAIRCDAGTILHTGDFKMDQLPLDGRITDLNGFARLGDAETRVSSGFAGLMIATVPIRKKNPCILIWNFAHFDQSTRATPSTPIRLADTGVKASTKPAPIW